MKRLGPILLSGIFVGLYLVFLFWYGGSGKPLSESEINAFITEIQRRAGATGLEESVLLRDLRNLAKSDDGKEFYMVNLLKYRKKALYPKGYNYNDDAMAANTRYSHGIVPALLKYGGHPVFLGRVQGRFIHPTDADDWDQVGIVRYRSRRDLMKMVVGIAGTDLNVHKWAALEKTQVFPVKPEISFVFVRGLAAVIFALTGLFLHLLLRGLNVYGKPRT
ncbi:MAG: hypothetical protein JW950_03355 [Deltaproteobacteria bacterium]|nr:hypothetical protein [Deltaproteobacteria bacterium]